MKSYIALLFSLLSCLGCSESSSDYENSDTPEEMYFCLIEYSTPQDYSLEVGELPPFRDKILFCRWEDNGFIGEKLSKGKCDPSHLPDIFPIRKMNEYRVPKGAGLCGNVEFRSQVRAIQPKTETYDYVEFSYNSSDIADLEYTIGYARQRLGYPTKTVYTDYEDVVVELDPKFNPWGDHLCESYVDYIQSELPQAQRVRCRE